MPTLTVVDTYESGEVLCEIECKFIQKMEYGSNRYGNTPKIINSFQDLTLELRKVSIIDHPMRPEIEYGTHVLRCYVYYFTFETEKEKCLTELKFIELDNSYMRYKNCVGNLLNQMNINFFSLLEEFKVDYCLDSYMLNRNRHNDIHSDFSLLVANEFNLVRIAIDVSEWKIDKEILLEIHNTSTGVKSVFEYPMDRCLDGKRDFLLDMVEVIFHNQNLKTEYYLREEVESSAFASETLRFLSGEDDANADYLAHLAMREMVYQEAMLRARKFLQSS